MSSTKVDVQSSNRALLDFHSRIKDYIILEKIGHGAYASVYKACKQKDKNEFVAIKCFEKTKLSQPEAIENIITEIKMLKMLRHPSIVDMIEFLWDDRFVYIVMEYCDGGDLSKFIQKRHRIPENIFQKFLQQLAMALFYLRGFNISHLDLKPSNLLLVTKPQLTLKIGDFGLAQFLSNEAYQGALRGSPLYMAPEMLLRRHFDAKCDLWSVGIIAYECLFGKAPFSSCNFKELRDKLIAETPIEIPENFKISRRCRELLRRLLKYNPEERIDFDQFFSHPFVDVSHQPSPKTYSYAVELLHQAVKHDADKEFKEAFSLYCDALSYLIPHVHAEKDEVRKQVLQSRLLQYTERAESLLAVTKLHKSQGAAQTPRALKEMCLSTPALLTAVEIGISGDLYFAERMYKKAQEKYEIALEMLIDLIPKEPPGLRKDRLLRQTNEWVSQATRTKALADMAEINNPPVDVSEVREMCVLQ